MKAWVIYDGTEPDSVVIGVAASYEAVVDRIKAKYGHISDFPNITGIELVHSDYIRVFGAENFKVCE